MRLDLVARRRSSHGNQIPYLKSNPQVFLYSWFSASPIPKAVLMNSDGSPNALGQAYAGLAQSCP